MQRVHQMILAEVGCSGLEVARSRLKKTKVTTVVNATGVRKAVTRDENGVEHEEIVSKREADISYLRGYPVANGESAPEDMSTTAVAAKAPMARRCDEDILDVSPAPRFDISDPALMDHLTEHGYAIVKDIVTSSERSRAEDLLWNFLHENAGFDRWDAKTWTDDNFERVGCVGTGIIDGAGIGQSDFMWYLRTLPQVREVFTKIWSTELQRYGSEELLVSFDAANIFRPWRNKELGVSRTQGGWYHLDQGRCAPGKECVQGLVTLLDVDASTGGLVVIPGSHKKFEEIVRFQYTEDNYVSIPATDPILELPKKLVTCTAGDLVLWDSRCVHCNAPGRLAPENVVDDAYPELLRMVGYVCMTPKAMAAPDVLTKRLDAYQKSLTTSHWPHLFNPVRAGKQVKEGSGPPLSIEVEQFIARSSLIH